MFSSSFQQVLFSKLLKALETFFIQQHVFHISLFLATEGKGRIAGSTSGYGQYPIEVVQIICSIYRSIWATATARNYQAIRSVCCSQKKTHKTWEKLWYRLISLDSSFLSTWMIYLFLSICVCANRFFSLQLVLRNCFSSPRTLLCGLLQQNQLNLISALFSTWKEPFTEFCRKHRPKFFSCLQWSWRITERAKTCTWWCTAESGGLGEVVWSYVKNDLSFPIEPVSTSLRSLQPPATVLSPKAQPGAMPLLLAGILKQSWYWAWPRTWFPVCSSGASLCNTSCSAVFVFLVSAC